MQTLGELGYAKASLREIAQNSEFSHGVVHYYFHDKTELIVYCVRRYKATCVHRYDGAIAGATSGPDLIERFADKLTETLRTEPAMHRLWYDVRTRSLFDDVLREPVAEIDQTVEDMVWRIISRYAELEGRPPHVDAATAYAIFDGLFQRALFGHLNAAPDALDVLVGQVRDLLPLMLEASA